MLMGHLVEQDMHHMFAKSQPPVWNGTPKNEPENMSFEDMLARFKTKSDERMSDLKKNTAAKRGSSTPRRGGGATQRGF